MNRRITLGDYEKAVLLELSKSEASLPEVQWLMARESRLRLMGCIISECYDHRYSIIQAVNKIYSVYNLPMHKCVLEGVAVLSNN